MTDQHRQTTSNRYTYTDDRVGDTVITYTSGVIPRSSTVVSGIEHRQLTGRQNNWIQIADSLGMPVSKTWNVNIQKIAILQAGGFTLSICTHTRKNHGFLSGAHVVPDTGPAKLVLMHADYRNSLFLI